MYSSKAMRVPAGVSRDLLAITRALYATSKAADGAGPVPDTHSRRTLDGDIEPDPWMPAGVVMEPEGFDPLSEALSNGDVTVAKLVANWLSKVVQLPER